MSTFGKIVKELQQNDRICSCIYIKMMIELIGKARISFLSLLAKYWS